ncbi:MAG: hypothetical protein KKF52_05590 [Nanoarchaeota archaeon]|nr:hypothetical protein [Nanoarchaeota archaeon]MCG2720074.1 hypothetical protein [Nanoarchaeota archaeon]
MNQKYSKVWKIINENSGHSISLISKLCKKEGITKQEIKEGIDTWIRKGNGYKLPVSLHKI